MRANSWRLVHMCVFEFTDLTSVKIPGTYILFRAALSIWFLNSSIDFDCCITKVKFAYFFFFCKDTSVVLLLCCYKLNQRNITRTSTTRSNYKGNTSSSSKRQKYYNQLLILFSLACCLDLKGQMRETWPPSIWTLRRCSAGFQEPSISVIEKRRYLIMMRMKKCRK